MAKGKGKGKGKTPTPKPTVRRPAMPSVASPGEMAPRTSPSFSDQTKKTQKAILRSMADEGKRVYGYPITLDDAVATRVRYIQSAIDRSDNGIPEGIGWFSEHQEDVKQVTEAANKDATNPVSVGRMINATAPLSVRNTPKTELRAARSAGWIAAHPDTTVDITDHMSEAVTGITGGKVSVSTGTHRIGHLSSDQIALLGRAETELINTRGGERSLDRGITSATLDSTGWEWGSRAIRATRGEPLEDIVKDAPKIINYAGQTHLANEPEDQYNREVFWRRAHDFSTDASGKTWQQGHLLSAAEVSGFDPSTPGFSVEDYIGNDLSAEEAARKGNTGATSHDAQELIEPKKGKRGTFPADLTSKEIKHAFNEHATKLAAEQFAHTSFTNDGDVREAPRFGTAAQPVFWVQYQHEKTKQEDPAVKARKDKKRTLEAEGEQVQQSMFPDLVPEVNQFGDKPKKRK